LDVPSKYTDGTVDNGCKQDETSLQGSSSGEINKNLEEQGDDSLLSPSRSRLKSMCGALSQLDKSAGKIVNHLKSTNQWKSTVFIFTSTNGVDTSSSFLDHMPSRPQVSIKFDIFIFLENSFLSFSL
jgi:hypothetical protein